MDAVILANAASDSLVLSLLTHLLTGCCQAGAGLATVIALGGPDCA